MKEKIYTIPVSDGFDSGCECPICFMEHKLEEEAIQYVMGPSYMEDDIRTVTNELGFCTYHVEVLSKQKNTLGLALMLQTHIAKTSRDIKKLAISTNPLGGGLFKKKESTTNTALLNYISKLENSCYVCNKVNTTMDRYIDTIFLLWSSEESFREKLKASKGFCTKHFGILHKEAIKKLSAKDANEFLEIVNKLYLENMDRISEDLEWFVGKFDYRNKNEPWKESKDAVQRTILKTNGKII